MKINRIPAFFDNSQCTYFRSSDVAPAVSDDGKAIEVYDGEGVSRSWGRAFCASYTLTHTRTFVVVLVGYKHKHNGGQGYYYFERQKDGSLHRRTASQLSTRRRKQVMDAYDRLAPSWSKRPFDSVEKPKRSPAVKQERFKQVAQDVDGALRSIYDGTEYELGKTKREAAKPDHGGGFYVYRSPEEAQAADFPRGSRFKDLPRVILKVQTWGKNHVYGNNKESWSYCKPLTVVA